MKHWIPVCTGMTKKPLKILSTACYILIKIIPPALYLYYDTPVEKINRTYIRYARYALQAYVLLVLLYAGYRFYLFVTQYEHPGSTEEISLSLDDRPASVEGFLPIGALMSLKLWITTGVFDRIHPAGLVIFIAALLMAVLLKKGFCGWICPVGALSDAIWKLRQRVFTKRFSMNRWVDYALRSIKYILMALFIYIIVIKMDPGAIAAFIEGDYYKIADVKMLYFFTRMSTTTLVSLLVLFVLSLVYRNFWCRYLCPYGGLLGLLSMLSPLKVTRNNEACIHCNRCSENCPSSIRVAELSRIRTPECTGCLTCVSHCPAKGALDVAMPGRRPLHPGIFVLLVSALFFGTLCIGWLTGNWKSAVTSSDYQRIIPATSFLEHP
ncbi:MAG: 4Fe-4S binding protein [Thermodesulfovibrio sp.]|nr:4Fe-4S binding protein [Thermodesulfovibrio sp.]